MSNRKPKAEKTTEPAIVGNTVLAAVPYQCCPLCNGNGQTVADGFTSSVYQTCKVCNGARIIPMHIVEKHKIMSTEKNSLENENQPSCLGAVSGSFLFDKSLLEKAIIKQPEYVMGVDTYDKDALAYCFGRKVDGVFEIMLSKTMRDEKEFKQEVENLAKYFNADVFRSGE